MAWKDAAPRPQSDPRGRWGIKVGPLPTPEEFESLTNWKLAIRFPRLRPILKLTKNHDGSINMPMRRRVMRLMYGKEYDP